MPEALAGLDKKLSRKIMNTSLIITANIISCFSHLQGTAQRLTN